VPVTRRGFTLVELTVSLMLGALAATAAIRLLVGTRRLHDAALARLDVQANLRAGAAILAAQLRELATGAPPDGDLHAMAATSVAYRAVRGLFRTCRPAVGSTVILDAAPLLGRRLPNPTQDELTIYLPDEERWALVDAVGLTVGTDCPGGRPSAAIQVNGVAPAVPAGAPVRAGRRFEVRLYRGGDGAWWIGGREFVRHTGTWAATQPVVGPVTPGGLLFTFFAADQSETADPARVARIGVTLIMVDGDGGTASLTLSVALRNRAQG